MEKKLIEFSICFEVFFLHQSEVTMLGLIEESRFLDIKISF